MCLAQFVGALSPFEILVAVIAIVTGAYTLYKDFLELAKLAAYPGDRISLVISGGGGCRKFQLRANLVNHGVKMGTLHRLEARVARPGGFDHRFQWRLFFAYVAGGQGVEPEKDPHPISVAGRSSELLFAEFEIVPPGTRPRWPSGRYQVELMGWVNKENRVAAPNLSSTFHFNVDEALERRLAGEQPAGPILVHVPIEEWAIPN